MNNIIPQPTPTPSVEGPAACPDWCITDHGDRAGVIVHESDRQTFAELQVAFGEEQLAPVVLWQTRSDLPDGTVVREGAVLNDHFLDREGLESFLRGIQQPLAHS